MFGRSAKPPLYRWIPHAGNNNLFSSLRGAGSSMAIVTEFLYMIYETPEADPAVLLAWIEDKEDLETIHRAAKVRYVLLTRKL